MIAGRNWGLKEKAKLNFIIREFLELDGKALASMLEANRGLAETFWNRLEDLLFQPTDFDGLEGEDRAGTDFTELVVIYHSYLQPIWSQFGKHLQHFRYRVLPDREFAETIAREPDEELNVSIDGEEVNVADLMRHGMELTTVEQSYLITLPNRIRTKGISLGLSHIRVTFEGGKVHFMESKSVLDGFLKLLADLPIEILNVCAQCNKWFVKVRADKESCSQACAAKVAQKRRWENDPEGCKEKERVRYREKRRPKLQAAPTGKGSPNEDDGHGQGNNAEE